MGDAAKFVVKADGTFGIIPNGKACIYNSAGNACDCCGVCGFYTGFAETEDYTDDFSSDDGNWSMDRNTAIANNQLELRGNTSTVQTTAATRIYRLDLTTHSQVAIEFDVDTIVGNYFRVNQLYIFLHLQQTANTPSPALIADIQNMQWALTAPGQTTITDNSLPLFNAVRTMRLELEVNTWTGTIAEGETVTLSDYDVRGFVDGTKRLEFTGLSDSLDAEELCHLDLSILALGGNVLGAPQINADNFSLEFS